MNCNLYRHQSSFPKGEAQANLRGRTHYVDDDTLRYHKARVLSTRIIDDGLLFALIESVALDMDNTRRGFRYVVFDIFGHIVSRVDLEDSFRTRGQASKAMWDYLDAIDAIEITREAVERERRNHEHNMAELLTAVASIATNRRAAA